VHGKETKIIIYLGTENWRERKTGAILWMCMCVFRRNKENVAGEREREREREKKTTRKKIKTALLHSHGK